MPPKGGIMKDIYKVYYQKRNGEVIIRTRHTLPFQTIGEYTSMGWLIIDIKKYFQYRWYSLDTEYLEYKQAVRENEKNPKLYWDLKEWA